jgi:DNA-binding CsgD family transcriptional regulator
MPIQPGFERRSPRSMSSALFRGWTGRTRNCARAASGYGPATPHGETSLTPRETQIALEVATGASNREVAAALFLTPKTIEFHLTRIYRKLGVHTRGELIRLYASDHGPTRHTNA